MRNTVVMFPVKVFLWGILLPAFFSTQAMADIYRFVDEDGVAHFTNVPADSRFEPLGWEEEFERYIVYYETVIQRAAARYRVEPALIKAVIKAESNFDPSAVSRKGAIGLMQLMPSTAAMLNISNPYNPYQNIEGGARHLRYLSELFDNDIKLVIAAYNAGENAVIKHGMSIPPYRETRDYVRRVKNYLAYYRKDASGRSVRN